MALHKNHNINWKKLKAKASMATLVIAAMAISACSNKSDLSYYLATKGVKGPGIPDQKEVPRTYKKRLAEVRLRNELAKTVGVKIPDLDEQLSQKVANFEAGDFYKFDNPDITWTVRDVNQYQVIWADNAGGQQVSYPNPILPALEWSSVRRGNGTRKISDIDGDIFPLEKGNVMTFKSQVEATGGANGQNISWEFDWRCEVIDEIPNYPTLVGSFHVYNVLCGRDGRKEIAFYYAPRVGFYVRMEIFNDAGKPPTVRNLQEFRNKWLANEEKNYYDLITKRQRAEALLYKENDVEKPIKGTAEDGLPPASIFAQSKKLSHFQHQQNNNLNGGLGLDNLPNRADAPQPADIGIEQELSQLLQQGGNFANDNVLQPYQPNLDAKNVTNQQGNNRNLAVTPNYQQQQYKNVRQINTPDKSSALGNVKPANIKSKNNIGYHQQNRAVGGFQLHLASYRTADQAKEGWYEYVANLRGLISDLQPMISKVDLGNRGVYYRLMAQGLNQRQQATQRCSLIQDKIGYCKIFAR